MPKRALIEMMRSGKDHTVELPKATMRVHERMASDPKNEIWVLAWERMSREDGRDRQ